MKIKLQLFGVLVPRCEGEGVIRIVIEKVQIQIGIKVDDVIIAAALVLVINVGPDGQLEELSPDFLDGNGSLLDAIGKLTINWRLLRLLGLQGYRSGCLPGSSSRLFLDFRLNVVISLPLAVLGGDSGPVLVFAVAASSS